MHASIAISTAGNRRLLAAFHRTRDVAVREALVHRFLPLALHLARRYHAHGHAFEDLSQVAAVGLLKAIDRFDPSHETEFSTFATPTIAGELKRHFRDTTWAVRVPRALQELAFEVTRAAEALERELGRAPTVAQIAERVDRPMEDVLEAHRALRARYGASLDGTQQDDDDDRGPADRIAVIDDGYRRVEDAATLETLMTALSPQQREMLRLRFGHDLKQADIAERMGVSQMHVSRSIRRATARMSKAAGAAALR